MDNCQSLKSPDEFSPSNENTVALAQGEPCPQCPELKELEAELLELKKEEAILLKAQTLAKQAYRQKHSGQQFTYQPDNQACRIKLLKEAESRHQFLLESNILPIYKVNQEGRILWANQELARLLEFPRHLLLDGQLPVEAITPAECLAKEQKHVQDLKTSLISQLFETERLTAQGEKLSVAAAFRLAKEDLSQWFVFLLDLKEQKLLEEKLAYTQELFSALVQDMPHMTFMINSQGQMRQFNRRFYEFTGTQSKNDTGYSWQEKIHPEDLESWEEKWQNVSNDSPQEKFQDEIRILAKNGNYYWHLFAVQPLKNPPPEQLEGLLQLSIGNLTSNQDYKNQVSENKSTVWIGTATDTDERKQLLEEVLESAHLFQTIADQIPQIVWTAGGDGKIDFFNNRWFQFSGLTRAHRVGLDFALFIHPEDRKNYMSCWRNCIKTGEAFDLEFRLKANQIASPELDAQNGYRRFLARAVSIRNTCGQIAQWVGTWTPID